MAAPVLFDSLLNHLALNPRPPGHQDARLDTIDRAIIERVLDATIKLCRLPDNSHTNALESLRRSIDTCRRVNVGGRLTKFALVTAFRELNNQDMIIIHVGEQNAGLLIRKDLEEYVLTDLNTGFTR